MKIGFIGFGEAAFCIASGLKEEGIHEIVAYDAMMTHPVMGQQVHMRATKAEVTLLSNAKEVAANTDLLFVAVPSSYALDVCKEVVQQLHAGQIYADVSASTPSVKNLIWEQIKDTGVLFSDSAMLGSLPQDRHKVPIVASGNGAESFSNLMAPYGMNITTISESPGAASAIKLVRSIFMKGLGSLMTEMLQAADRYGISNEVIASIGKSLDNIPFTQHLDRLTIGTAIHAKRRATELKGSIQMLEECEIDASMAIAAKQKHELIAEYNINEKFVGNKPKGWSDVIGAIK